ncbi:MAG: lipoyltransferase [Muribaculaceae bacterium]|nr:lipoyltransferase [Muribaculaceae bacterium]MBQ4008455.1 lipoyltransferase [Muribaculaceae bacterium]
MKYLLLPDDATRILPFYLAMEEYAARIMADEDIFFMWQPDPTVIFGRNQLIDNEVNLDYCKEHGIAVYRRKSGGGCVYADRDNIMFSYITRSDNVQLTFSRYTHAVAEMLQGLGLNATDNGRNDILIDGLKVSGNAFYHIPGHSIVHGTMLYDTNMEHMLNAITPSSAKLESKGVESVRSRITTLSEHLDMSIDDFKAHVKATLCDGEIVLNDADVAQIDAIMQSYLTPEFIYGNNPRCNLVKTGRIEGVGEMQVSLELNHNVIRHIDVAGDFFLLGNLDDGIIAPLTGVNFERTHVQQALEGVDLGKIIANLNNQQLINLLFD